MENHTKEKDNKMEAGKAPGQSQCLEYRDPKTGE